MNKYCKAKKGESQNVRPQHVWTVLGETVLQDDGMSQDVRVERICGLCGTTDDEVHHFDYSLPFEIDVHDLDVTYLDFDMP